MDVVVNAAMSVDGKLSTRRREQIKISGDNDFARVDRIRTAVDGILVGIGTVVADDPHLRLDDPDCRAERRDAGRPVSPARVVIDSQGRTPPDSRICDDEAATYVVVSEAAPVDNRRALREAGPTVLVAGDSRVDLGEAVAKLEAAGLESLLIEGGGEIIYSAFEAGIVDELSVFVGSLVIGGREAPTLADGEGFIEAFPQLSLTAVDDESHFEELINSNSPVLVDFYADWCGPCKMLEPTIEEIAAETDAAVLKVDIDELQAFASQKGVRSVPTLEFYQDGESVDRVIGVQDKDDLLKGLEEISG